MVVPSETLIVMPLYVPTLAAVGVPLQPTGRRVEQGPGGFTWRL